MDAGRALADLVEISPQIEAAAIVSGEGETVGSFGIPEERAGLLARAVLELLDPTPLVSQREDSLAELIGAVPSYEIGLTADLSPAQMAELVASLMQ